MLIQKSYPRRQNKGEQITRKKKEKSGVEREKGKALEGGFHPLS